ncbi:DC-STAMP domain-containing protein 2 [Eupeodes corollae]|uniref:DC-STAMP domain-containing protein 2 n=1 Tax=Eupeodes corollae TaxID=290404 RepID=UPI002490E46F|nr:DC-STAMP domain-containing protein 2 [Eupeodes corollae]
MSSFRKYQVNEIKSDTKKFPWKSFFKHILTGYLIGLSITLIWFLYHFSELPCLQRKSTLLLLGLLLLYGFLLAFSKNIRCISTLILPILFSSKGRSVLVASAIVLAATGPTVNILNNVDILMESISCGQEQLKGALGKMLDLVKRPLVTVKNAIKISMAEIKKVLKRVEEVLIHIRSLITDILEAIKKAFDWLGNVVSMCNKEIGTPFDRCIKIADDAMTDCKEQMGILDDLCNVTEIFRGLCYSVKFIDVICELMDFVSDSIIATVTEKLKQFNDDIKRLFYVSIKFDHEFNFKTVATKNLTDVGNDILSEINNQMNEFFVLFTWTEFVGSFMVFFVILKALLYKNKYLTSNHFDNHFIAKDFISLNNQREKMGLDVVLPLTRKERRKYVMITSLTLVHAEIFSMSRTFLFLTISSVQLLCICIADYSLYWLLSMIYFYGKQEAGLEIPPFLTVNISGGGFTAEILKGIVHAFEPLSEKYELDPRPCLPKPIVPNYRRYWEIVGLIFIAWVFLILQPYGLRLRQVIMCIYYPDRSRERALWLYNEILLRRTSFIKFARRQARRSILKDSNVKDYSLLDWIRSRTNQYWIFRKIFGSGKLKACNICGTPLKGEESSVNCQQIGCSGMYCAECFGEMNNICCLCQKPVDYNDLSDISEEKDSSDELEEIQVKGEK